jgi:putative membrane protein
MSLIDLVTAAVLLVSSGMYAAGVIRLWRHAGAGRGIRWWQIACFAAGIATLAIALLSRLAVWSQSSFALHMTQHELLMLVAAPLLIVAQPGVAFMWALPAPWRPRVAALRTPKTLRWWRHLTSPVTVFALHGAAIWIWHLPALFGAALDHDAIHALQHVSFTASAALFWWAMVNGRYGRLGYGAAVAYVFITAVHTSALGALLVFASSPWLPEYVRSASASHVDPLADQQLAGLLMWIPSGTLFMLLGLGLFAAWIGESNRRVRTNGRLAEASRPS